MTKSHPIRSLLRHLVLFGRLAQWLLQLSEFEFIPIAPTAVKGQAIADLLVWFPEKKGGMLLMKCLGIYQRFQPLKQLELSEFLGLMGLPLLLKEELE